MFYLYEQSVYQGPEGRFCGSVFSHHCALEKEPENRPLGPPEIPQSKIWKD